MADYSDYKECTDCVHYELCLHQEKFLIEHNRKDLIRRYGFGLSEPEICCNFRDRSRFVEFPYKLGDSIYEPKRHQITEYQIARIVFYDFGLRMELRLMKGLLFRVEIKQEDIGKVVYLTLEEAEQALKLKTGDTNA